MASPLWDRIKAIICTTLGLNPDQITDTTSVEAVEADSLDVVEFVMQVEKEFGITIPDEEAQKIKTVGDAIDWIDRYLK
jgi:acyl carrier protein